jgi:AraC-like DNA-binding protein
MASGYILGDGVLLTQLSGNKRTNTFWTIVYVKRGIGMYMLDSAFVCLNEGDIVILPPRVSFSFVAKDLGDEYNVKIDAVVLQFDSAWLDAVLAAFPAFSDVVLKVKELGSPLSVWGPKWIKLSALLDDALSCSSSLQPLKIIEVLYLLSTPYDYSLIRHVQECDAQTTAERKAKIDRFLECNYYNRITLETISSYVGMSRTYFSQFFKLHYNEGFSDHLTRVRVEKASVMLLHTDKPLPAIANECGFKTVQYFTRAFKKVKGVTPGAFRRKSDQKIDS